MENEEELLRRAVWARKLESELAERTGWALGLDRELAERTQWALDLDRQLADFVRQTERRQGEILASLRHPLRIADRLLYWLTVKMRGRFGRGEDSALRAGIFKS